MERTLVSTEKAYKNLKAVATLLEAVDSEGILYSVGDCYLDFGQNWMWTTIIAHDPNSQNKVLSSWQALTPRQWKEIEAAETIEELAEIASKIK